MRFLPLLVCAALSLSTAPAFSQTHTMHGQPQDKTDMSPSTRDYKATMEKMHKGMDISYSGDADKDFIDGMVPHHQGAVDMAKVELEHGKDPELKALAQSIIASQSKEIAFLKAWREKNYSK